MLPYGRQTIDDEDIAAVIHALRAPQLTCGPRVARFEQALANWLGASNVHVSACSSGTAALHLAYAALGIGEGDEVITSPITFSATAAAAYYVGARVRFADVDPDTGNLSAATVEPLITSRTRAIVPVHLAGQPVDLDPIVRLARARGLRVIEDACHALGATYRGAKIGTGASDAVVFSFHPVKHITTLEGGAVVMRTPQLKARVDRLRQHGIERDPARMDVPPAGPWVYEVQELGWNYRLSDVACALGISQLAKLDGFVASRRALASVYRESISALDLGVEPAPVIADRESAYHLFTVAIDFHRFDTTRAQVMAALADAGIGTQVHYIPLLQHPLHATRCPGERAWPRPGVDRYYERTLSLPLHPAMTADDARCVVRELAHVLATPHAKGPTR
jgi:UDP-4-amino-4,6-dideoxy-N-acetyl-beta-L-altrosamine transaminase